MGRSEAKNLSILHDSMMSEIMTLGFNEAQASEALQRTEYASVEHAIEWLTTEGERRAWMSAGEAPHNASWRIVNGVRQQNITLSRQYQRLVLLVPMYPQEPVVVRPLIRLIRSM